MLHAPSHRADAGPLASLTGSLAALLVSCVALVAFFGAPSGARAQVVTDASLGAMTAHAGPAFALDATDGALSGNTLYLSLATLRVAAGETLTISVADTVEHVVVRVTGPMAAQLDGVVTLNTESATLIVACPAGVAVGSGGGFSVPGALVLTTADYVRASSGTRFQVPPVTAEVLPDTAPAHLGFVTGLTAAVTVDDVSLTLVGDLLLAAGAVLSTGATFTANHVAIIGATVGELNLATLDVSSMSGSGTARLTDVALTSELPPLVLPSGCGNGFVEPGEACDGGDNMSATTPDFCRPGCVAPACGDGVVDSVETCDLGVALNSDTAVDGCRTSCQLAGCGDGIMDTGEVCDDGSMNSDTTVGACRTNCTYAICGDGVRVAGEQCDDGEANNSDTAVDACRSDCRAAGCGDGVIDTGEECDDGADNSSGAADACREDCTLPRCGDRVVDNGEVCDDGPFNSDDVPERCRLDCLSENGPLELVGGACDVPSGRPGQGGRQSEWPLGLFVVAAVAVLVPLRRRVP
jgi:filamentous hemagglutinin family protein